MACSRPFYIKGVTDFRGIPVAVPCRTCMNCRNDIMNEWLLRATYEKTHHHSSLMVTFTYNDFWLKVHCFKKGSVNASLNREILRKYIDTIRHIVKKKYPMFSNFSYLCCGEYGDKFKRPHYHIAFFGLPYKVFNDLIHSWPYGSIDIKPLKSGGTRYILKYLTKQGLNKRYYNLTYLAQNVTPPFISYSRSFGAGLFYEHRDELRKTGLLKLNGTTFIPVNSYWKNKYFDFSLENIFRAEKRLEEFKRKKYQEQSLHYKNYADMRARQLIAKEKRLYNKAVNSLSYVDCFGRRPDSECYYNLTSPPSNYYDSFKRNIYSHFYEKLCV